MPHHRETNRVLCVVPFAPRCGVATLAKAAERDNTQHAIFYFNGENMSLSDSAMAYAQKLNWYVFPIQPRGKRPITAHGLNDATNDQQQIRAWWNQTPNANIGIDCGRSNLAVIDLDGATGFETWNTIVDSAALPFTKCAVQDTGSGEGIHLVYAQPETRVRNTAGKLGAGIDTRGDGGYILVAPSVHPSGGVYTWRKEFLPTLGIETFPQELLKFLVEAIPQDAPKEYKPLHFPLRALQRAYERVANAPAGSRNDTLNRTAFYLYHLVYKNEMSEQDVFDTLMGAALRVGLTERETRATLHSARKAAMVT